MQAIVDNRLLILVFYAMLTGAPSQLGLR
jgi:hypothetical protein